MDFDEIDRLLEITELDETPAPPSLEPIVDTSSSVPRENNDTITITLSSEDVEFFYVAANSELMDDVEEEPAENTENPSTEEESREKNTLLDKLKKSLLSIKDAFISHYGVELVSFPDIDSITPYPGGDEYFIIMVLFPEIDINNSVEEKHTIKDLYVEFKFKYYFYYDSFKVVYITISGIRGTVSLKEYLAGYNFSHLSGAIERWGIFCLGSGGMDDSSYHLSYGAINEELSTIEDFIDKLNIFLFNFDSYLTWESINTTPYKYMSTVGTVNRFLSTDNKSEIEEKHRTAAKSLLTKILLNKELRNQFIDECFINVEDLFTLNIYKTSFFLDGLLKEDVDITNSLFKKSVYNPITFTIENSTEEYKAVKETLTPEGVIENGEIFIFNGKKIKQKVSDYVIEPKKDEYFEIINPVFIAAFISETLKLFNYIRYYETEFNLLPTKISNISW